MPIKGLKYDIQIKYLYNYLNEKKLDVSEIIN